jgi:ATP-dependent helicase/nuclease subunit A
MTPERPTASPHLVIRASAGAGKTYQLTTRYLDLLRRLPDDTGPEAILATTFTRKAAGEILGRIFNRLAEAAEDPDSLRELNQDLRREGMEPEAGGRRERFRSLGPEQCLALLRKLVDSLHRVAVGTIDSFFNRVAQSFLFELDLPTDSRLAGEGDAIEEQLRNEAVEALLESGDELTGRVLEGLLLRQQRGKASRSVAESLSRLVGRLYNIYLEAPQPEAWSALQVPEPPDERELERVVSALAALEPELPRTTAEKPNATWKKVWQGVLEACRQGRWQQAASSTLVARAAAGDPDYARAAIDDAWRQPCSVIAQKAASEVLGELRQRTETAQQLLQRYDHHYRQLQRRRGVVTFADVTRRLARDLPGLGGEVVNELYYRLDGRIAHVLVDEFQDTSIDQWSVLEPLVDEVVASGDGSRSYFCVGDTKQSIYGWRGGCSELFDRVGNLYARQGLREASLNVSYRSSPVVLEAVNRVFGEMQQSALLKDAPAAAARWDAEFGTHLAVEKNRKLPGYVRYMTTVAGSEEAEPAEQGAEDGDDDGKGGDGAFPSAFDHESFVAERVAEICADSPGRSVGILVRSHKMAERLLHALESRGMRASGEGGNPLTDTSAVNAVLSAVLLGDHPGDSAAAFHLANSPLGEIVGLSRDNWRSQAGSVSRAIRAWLLQRGYAGTIADWTEKLAPSCDRRSLFRLVQLTVQADAYDAERTLRPADFVAEMESVRVEQPAAARVRVMTIHAAKGLEFDAVVLPELSSAWRAELNWLVERGEPAGPVTGVFYCHKQAALMSEQLGRAREAALGRERFEDLCTLYVAMTRARHALHLLVPALRLKKDGNLKTNTSSATLLLERLVPDPADRVRAAQAGQILYEIGDARWAETMGVASEAAAEELVSLSGPLVRRTKRPLRSFAVITPSSLESGGTVTGRDLLGLGAEEGRRYGSLMHAWFEQVVYIDQEGGLPGDALLREIAAREAPAATRQWVEERIAEFRQMLRRPAIAARLKKAGEAHLWRERSFAVRAGDAILRGVFDRVVVFEDDRYRPRSATIMDYKTDDVSPGNLERAVERYRPQLGAYRQALSAMLGLPRDAIECQLLFVCAGIVHSV